MADNKSPWDDSNDSPWQGEANTEKVVKFRRIKKSGGFSFDGGAKLIIGAAAALWLASGFYQVQTNEQGGGAEIRQICRHHRTGTALPSALPD